MCDLYGWGAVQLLRNARGGRPSVTLCDGGGGGGGGSAERYVTPLKYICIIYIIIFYYCICFIYT